MLEIIAILGLAALIGRQAKEKGLKKWPYQLMVVVLWVCGEFIGALFAGILGKYFFDETLPLLYTYLIALAGALTGAFIAFLILRWIPDSEFRVITSESGDGSFQTVNNPPFQRSAWVPALAGIIAASCLCLTFGGLVIVGIANAGRITGSIHASTPVLSYGYGRENSLSEATNVIPTRASRLFVSYSLDLPSDYEAIITYLILYEGSPLVSFAESHERGQVLTIIEPSVLGKNKFPEGDYVIEIKYGNITLSSAAFHVGEVQGSPLTQVYPANNQPFRMQLLGVTS